MNMEDLYRLLRNSHVQAQGIVDTIDEPLIVLDGQGCVAEANRAFFSTFMVDRDDVIGCPLRELGDGQWDIPALTSLISDVIPRATAVVDYEVTHDFPVIGRRTFLLTARRLWRPDGNGTHLLLVFSDVTVERDRQQHSDLLYSELRHRMSNLLGVVRAVANQTETKGQTADEYKQIFLGRFEAILKAQALLSSGAQDVDIEELVKTLVAGLGGSKLRLAGGPAIRIVHEQIVPFTMVLHELGTNALKYGAFADEAGAVDVSWQITPDAPRSLQLTWRETCSRGIRAPDRTGIGTRLIDTSARLGLHGSAELTFDQEGLTATVTVPLIEDHA